MFSSCTELLPGIMDTLDENYIVDSFTPSFDTSVITLPPEDQKPLSDEDKSLASRSNNSLDSFQQSNTSLDSFQSGGSDRSATLTRQSKLHVPGLVFNCFLPPRKIKLSSILMQHICISIFFSLKPIPFNCRYGQTIVFRCFLTEVS